MKRSIAVPGNDGTDLEWLQHLQDTGFTADEAQAITSLACDVAASKNAGAHEHTISLLTEAHAGTWFSVEGVSTICVFVKGALAGKPLADLVFCAAMGRCLTILHNELLAAGILFTDDTLTNGADAFWNITAPKTMETVFPLVAYMDDVAIPLIAPAGHIIDHAVKAVEIADSVFHRFRFTLNYSIGKSNLIVRIAGDGKQDTLKQLELHDFHISCRCRGATLRIPIVKTYQHVGRLTSPDRRVSQDIIMRGAQCHEKLRPITSKCFRAPDIDVADKINIGKSHLFSVLFVGAANWPSLCIREKKQVHTKTMHLWRSIMASHYLEMLAAGKQHLSDQELLNKYRLMAPASIVSLMRLNLFIRVVVKAAPSLKYALFAAMDAPQSWMKAVWLDILWIKPLSPVFDGLDTFQDWIREISLRPQKWKPIS